MKRILSLLIVLCTIFPQIVDGFSYNEPHEFQSQVESARNKTVAIVTAHTDRYTWGTYYHIRSMGSGTMIGNGLLLTNAHVIKGDEITITTYAGESYEGELLSVDKEKDLALVQFDSQAEGFSMSNVNLYRGKPIMTVGQPTGLPRWSFSEGRMLAPNITYTDTEGETHTGIQTDAQVISGASGGPLIDSDGELLGIIRAGGDESYAIPMADIRKFLEVIE